MNMTDTFLDTSGLDCPLPVRRAMTALEEMPAGATLEILATDPGSEVDFQAFCRITGNELLAREEKNGVYRFLIRKKF